MGCIVFLGMHTAASARNDAGIADFFARQFGIGAAPQASAPEWMDPQEDDRPLVVTPRPRRSPRVAKVEAPKGPVAPVSIFEDPTLRRGDAVMTAHGIRIFKGSDSMPYRENDFVAISNAAELPRTISKALLAIDQVPRI